MKKIIIPFLLLLALQGFAQTQYSELRNAGYLPPPKTHFLLKGILKTVGAGLLTYELTHYTANNNGGKGFNSTLGSKRVLPAICLDIGIGLPDIIKGVRKSKKTLSSEDIALISEQPQPLAVVSPAPFKGSMASSFNAQASGDCMGGGDGGGDSGAGNGSGPCNDEYKKNIGACLDSYSSCTGGCSNSYPHWYQSIQLLACMFGCITDLHSCKDAAVSSFWGCRL